MRNKKAKDNFLQKFATFAVDKRYILFAIYAVGIIFSLFSMNWVKVENDLTVYLPEETETRQGVQILQENFFTPATARVMVSNVTYETAEKLYEKISEVEGIQLVVFDSTENHYRDASAMYEVTFSGGNFDKSALDAVEEIRLILLDYDSAIDTQVGYDENTAIAGELTTILILLIIIILVVLTLTSRSYAEILVLLLAFGAAAILNLGTNFIFGKISFISNAIAVVLQLALAIDYAIILCHRFSDEHETKGTREACISALAKSIPEITASSLTTICGLAALAFMKFSIGLDMSMVLMKSIFLSLLSVFTVMPGLIMVFSGLIDRTRHKRLIPNITFLGKFAVKARYVMPVLFVIVLIGSFYLSSQCPYCYSYTDLKTSKSTERKEEHFAVNDVFGVNNMVAVVVPGKNYDAEKAILEKLETYPQVKSTTGLSKIEAMNGYCLTDALTPRQFSELVGLDYEVAEALYSFYAVKNVQYGEFISGLSEYKVPLFDMFLFLKDQMDEYNITLEGETQEYIGDMFTQLESAQKQMANENYSLMAVYLNLPEEGQETLDFLDEIRQVVGQYYDGDYYVIGNSTSARDLADSFASDNIMISVLSAFLVILVLIFTFRSIGLPILLIAIIQGSIWLNFSFPTITQQPLYFVGYLIVSAIQMGANIDYAIVISSHYQEEKKHLPPKKAIVSALNSAFPTVFTSGTIMTSTGFLIGNMSAHPVVSIMGNCMGRGTLISMILVLGVLPSILVLGDSIIEKTRFKFKSTQPPVQSASGTIKVNGRVRGYISGMVDADFDGVVHGDFEASVSSDGQISAEGEGGNEDE